MKRFLLPCAAVWLYAAAGAQVREDPFERPDIKLPSGKSQRDEIVRADHKKNREDAARMAELAAEIRDELERSDSHVLSVKTLKKIEDVEKLARAIRGRLRRN
jgi:hypothetical protein